MTKPSTEILSVLILAWSSVKTVMHKICYQVESVLTAACAVTWVQPTILAPSNGLSVQFRFLKSMSPGISTKNEHNKVNIKHFLA